MRPLAHGRRQDSVYIGRPGPLGSGRRLGRECSGAMSAMVTLEGEIDDSASDVVVCDMVR